MDQVFFPMCASTLESAMLDATNFAILQIKNHPAVDTTTKNHGL